MSPANSRPRSYLCANIPPVALLTTKLLCPHGKLLCTPWSLCEYKCCLEESATRSLGKWIGKAKFWKPQNLATSIIFTYFMCIKDSSWLVLKPNQLKAYHWPRENFLSCWGWGLAFLPVLLWYTLAHMHWEAERKEPNRDGISLLMLSSHTLYSIHGGQSPSPCHSHNQSRWWSYLFSLVSMVPLSGNRDPWAMILLFSS